MDPSLVANYFEVGYPLANSVAELGITPATFGTIRRHLRLKKNGGPAPICQHNPQQFHGWNRTENIGMIGARTTPRAPLYFCVVYIHKEIINSVPAAVGRQSTVLHWMLSLHILHGF